MVGQASRFSTLDKTASFDVPRIGSGSKLLLVALFGSGSRACRQGCPLRTGDAGDGQQQVLHLWGEFATLGFLLGEAEDPVEERTKKTPYDDLIQVSVLVECRPMGA
jgi:hypothetical protein